MDRPTTPAPNIIELALQYGASSYRNRSDTAHPAYGFTERGLLQFAESLVARARPQIAALHTIAQYPATESLLNMDAANMRKIATDAVAGLKSDRTEHPAATTTDASDQELADVIKERDDAEEFGDKLLDLVLGSDRPEWSSAYGTDDALLQVEEKMAALERAQEAPAAEPLPLLVRDIARDIGITPLDACQALKGLGNFSVNSAVTADMARKLRECFPEATEDSSAGDLAEVQASTLQEIAIEELYQLGYTFKDGRLIPPDHVGELVSVVQESACGCQYGTCETKANRACRMTAEIREQAQAAVQAEPVAWDGKLPESLQRALNEMRVHCKPHIVSGLEFEVRQVFEGMHTSLSTVRRMYWAANARLEAIDDAQPDPFAAPQAQPADALERDVRTALQMLQDREWAENFAKSDLGKQLESAITDLHSEIHEAHESDDDEVAAMAAAQEGGNAAKEA